jgi:superfamily I DNA/RNA helicase
MVSPNVNRILQAAQSLNDAERQELMRLLQDRAARQAGPSTEEQLRQALVERGLLEKQRPAAKDMERFRRWRPIATKGKPLSATIIEERR